MPESGPSPAVAGLLLRSLETGFYVADITISRLELLLRNWKHLPAVARQATGKQIRYAWEHNERDLARIAKRTGRVHIVRFAIRSIPGALDCFDRALARLPD